MLLSLPNTLPETGSLTLVAGRWDETPVAARFKTVLSAHYHLHHCPLFPRIPLVESLVAHASCSSSRWDSSASTPLSKSGAAAGGKSRWDETPVAGLDTEPPPNLVAYYNPQPLITPHPQQPLTPPCRRRRCHSRRRLRHDDSNTQPAGVHDP